MNAGRRFFGFVFLVLGAAGFLLSISGVAGVWLIRDPLRERLAEVFGRIEGLFAEADGDLSTVQAAIVQTRAQLKKVKDAPPPEGQEIKKQRLMVKTVARMAGQDLTPVSGNLRTTLGGVGEGAVVINGLLQGLDKLSFSASDGLNPDKVKRVSVALQEITKTTRDLSALLPEPGPGGAAPDPEGAERALDRIDELAALCQERLAEMTVRVDELKVRADVLTRWGPPVLTVLLFWIALGQVSLFVHGRSLLRKPQGPEPSPARSTAS